MNDLFKPAVIFFICSVALMVPIALMDIYYNSKIVSIDSCNEKQECRVTLSKGRQATCQFPKVGDTVNCLERKNSLDRCNVVVMPWRGIDD